MERENAAVESQHSASVPRRPVRLRRWLMTGSAAAIAVITLLVGLGVRRIYYDYVLRDAQASSVSIGEDLFAQARSAFVTSARHTGRSLAVVPGAQAHLDARMRARLSALGIVTMKVFDRDSVIIYSTDPALVGRVNVADPMLARVLRGETASAFRHTNVAGALAAEPKYGEYLVETYMPIRERGEVVGAFEIHRDVTWARAEVAGVLRRTVALVVVVLVAVFAALYVVVAYLVGQLIRARDGLHTLAITDPLTGIANRRYVLERADQECARLTRLHASGDVRGSVSFIMADVDHFRRINDAHGHLVGDELLRQVALRIRRAARRYDVVGRYGGEEFLVIVPDAGRDEACAVADRIREAVRDPMTLPDGTLVSTTISLGIACVGAADATSRDVIRRADEALYQAKARGRDRIVVSDDRGAVSAMK